MKLQEITYNIKSKQPLTVRFDTSKNIKVISGPNFHGKTSLISAAELALTKSCYVDSQGQYVRDGRNIMHWLNAGRPIHVTAIHTKGKSTADIEERNGSVPREWQDGYKLPQGQNLAEQIREILSQSPAKMADSLIQFVVRNVTAKDVRDDLVPNAAAILDTFLKNKNNTPAEALAKTIDHVKSALAASKQELTVLQAQSDPTTREPTDREVSEAKKAEAFWLQQRVSRNTWEASKRQDKSALEALGKQITEAQDMIDAFREELAAFPELDESKVDAYRAAKVLCDFAGAKRLESCPICRTATDPTLYPQQAIVFTHGIQQLLEDPQLEQARLLREKIEEKENLISNLKVQQRLHGMAVVAGSEPEYDSKRIDEELEKVSQDKARLSALRLRYKEQQDREAKILTLVKQIDVMQSYQKAFVQKKIKLIDSRFDMFLEKARTFMPAPHLIDDGLLHINVSRREVGFLRRGELHLGPSGAERASIVMAMAMAAGSNYNPAPPIFLPDVGWDQDFFEHCLNAWTAYSGEVLAQTTIKPRTSKIDTKNIEVINITDVKPVNKIEDYVPVVEESELQWVDRPDDYETSTMRSVVMDLGQGNYVRVAQAIRKGRSTVDNIYICKISGTTEKNVTAKTQSGAAFTIAKTSGVGPYDRSFRIHSVLKSQYEAKMRSNLHRRLGYPEDHDIPLDKMEAIWKHMISMEDYAERAHLVEENA